MVSGMKRKREVSIFNVAGFVQELCIRVAVFRAARQINILGSSSEHVSRLPRSYV